MSDELSVYSMAIREGNDLFSSFVNCVVLATMYAEEEDIEKENHRRIPQMSLFGPQFAWSLRDGKRHLILWQLPPRYVRRYVDLTPGLKLETSKVRR